MKNARYHTVKLPCKTYIKKYITALHGELFIANNKSMLGILMNACLEKNVYTNRAYTNSFIHQHYNDKLSIRISEWQFINIGFDFSDEKVIEINRFLECMFEEHLQQWVSVRMIGNVVRKKLIEQFVTMHGIDVEIDLSMDAFVKTEYRLRKTAEENIKRLKKQLLF